MTTTLAQATVASDRAHFQADFEKLASVVYRLKDRWADEREYEDFADYETIVKERFEKSGIKVTKVTKTFAITTSGGVTFKFYSTGKVSSSWKK